MRMYKKTENVSALGIGFQREEYHDSGKISIVWRIHGETGFATDSEPHIQLEELYQKTFNKPVETKQSQENDGNSVYLQDETNK
jgi:hypothetical protein